MMGGTPPLFLCKCSLHTSCTRLFRFSQSQLVTLTERPKGTNWNAARESEGANCTVWSRLILLAGIGLLFPIGESEVNCRFVRTEILWESGRVRRVKFLARVKTIPGTKLWQRRCVRCRPAGSSDHRKLGPAKT